MHINRKLLLIAALCVGVVFMQGFTPQHDDEQFTNLKILPKNISEKELDGIMKNFCKSLGVHCNFCHVAIQVEGQQRPKMDFASDDKPQKNTARNMIRMTHAINDDYLAKMVGSDHTLEQITCVTCHEGRQTPIVTVDSLMKK